MWYVLEICGFLLGMGGVWNEVERCGAKWRNTGRIYTDMKEMRYLRGWDVFEALRHEGRFVPLDEIRWCFHWINEGNLFEQCYDTDSIDVTHYVLRKRGGKSIEMPPLPRERFVLGGDGGEVCMTIDPDYDRAGFTGESKICLVFPFESLRDLKVENLTSNGEAEIRFEKVEDWDEKVAAIYIERRTWERGDGWEGFWYRPVQSWLPVSLVDKVGVFASSRGISRELGVKFNPLGS